MTAIEDTTQRYFSNALSKIRIVKKFLKENNFNDFMVVGSAALLACGMPLTRAINDVDLEVVCSEDDECIFKALADANDNDYYKVKEQYPEGCDHKPYIFVVNGIQVNVWAVSKFTHPAVIVDNIKFATVISTLRRKMQCKRLKDVKDLNQLVGVILQMTQYC